MVYGMKEVIGFNNGLGNMTAIFHAEWAVKINKPLFGSGIRDGWSRNNFFGFIFKASFSWGTIDHWWRHFFTFNFKSFAPSAVFSFPGNKKEFTFKAIDSIFNAHLELKLSMFSPTVNGSGRKK